ncbi:hypothetical protein [Nonomuraea insulae]|uniref:Aldouronate transport system substrate-binding protein n=1 Tax=Nonomuraea insulae TaxID=1616787 RepID=A0ABW1CZQ9_9ACTN
MLCPPRRVAMLAVLMTMLPLAACSSGANAGKSDPGTLTIFAPQDAAVDYKTNAFTKLMSEKFKVNLQFQTTTYDAGPASEKRQISLASGDYPDVYLLVSWVDQFSQAELLKFAKQGIIVPLNDLIAKYAPNIQKAFNDTPAFKTMATAPDGKIYGLPQWNDCFHCSYSAKLWMNSAWLKKLGLKQPATTDDLRAVLTAFKTKDPNGNGKADEIPLSGNTAETLLTYFMNAFLYDPQTGEAYPSTLALNNGQVQLQASQDKWRAGLKYIASLYSDGLIDEGAFTQNYDALKAKGDHADAVIVGAATTQNVGNLLTLGQKDGRDKNYDAMPPLRGPDGTSYAAYNLPSMPGASFVITNKASEQEQIAAIKMIDYLFTDEGHVLGEFGKQGVNWVKPASGDVALDKDLTPLFKTLPADPDNPAPTRNKSWGALTQYNSNKKFRGAQVQPTDIYDTRGVERRLFQATELYAGKEAKDQIYPYWNVWIGADEAAEHATLRTNIENYVSQSSLEFVTGRRNINDDVDWAAYLKGLDDLGLKRYLEIEQKAYQK